MRLGIIGYTNLTSGIGVFCREFIDYLGVDSILSVEIIKGQERWLKRQVDTPFPIPKRVVLDYLIDYRPDVVMFIETAFSDDLLWLAESRGVKTVAISMHETWDQRKLKGADLVACPCFSALEKAQANRANAKLMFLPIGLEMFPFRERTGHVFTQNLGYNEFNDRRQTAKVVRAFQSIRDPDARLILSCQGQWPPGVKVHDSRITYRQRETATPTENYEDGDIAILPMAYEGYGRTILESMASGMPVLTMDADPMNLFQHDPDFLLTPARRNVRNGRCMHNTVYNEVSVRDLAVKMQWLLTIDTLRYSRAARATAESMSWESTTVDYKKIWLETLEAL